MSNSGTLPPLRQHWTDDGIEKLLLVRAEREIEFDEVLGKTKGKKGQAGPTQSGLWELVAEELQSRYPDEVFVKNMAGEAEPISGVQCANKFYYLHSKLKTQAKHARTRDKDLPTYLLIPKVLFHLLGHTRSGNLPIEKQGIPTADKSKNATKAILEYVREQKCPSLSVTEEEKMTQDTAKNMLLGTFSVVDSMIESGKVPDEDTVDAWKQCIEDLDIQVDVERQPGKEPRKKPKSTPVPERETSSRLRKARHTNPASQEQQEVNDTVLSESDDEDLGAIVEKMPPMSAPSAKQSTQARRPNNAQSETRNGTSSNRKRGRNSTTSEAARYLIFEENPFADVIVKRGNSIDKAAVGSPEDELDVSTLAYQVDPYDRLREVIIYNIKEEPLSDHARKVLSLVYTAMSLEKYKPIFSAISLLACPDNHFMDIDTFVRLSNEKIQQLGINFDRLSFEFARK